MIKLCIFDLDGTLVNSLADIANSTNYALEANGFPKRKIDEFPYLIGDGVPTLIRRALGDAHYSDLEQKLLDDFNQYYSTHYADFTRPYVGCQDLLQYLLQKDIHLAVLSNKPDLFAGVIVNEMFPGMTFARVQGKVDKFPRKPDPALLLNILEELQVRPEDTLYVGDSNIDVFTAHKAGVKIIGAAWGFRGKKELMEAGADYIVDSPGEIMTLLETLLVY